MDVQDRILVFIAEYIRENEWAPSYRELCAATGVKSPSTMLGRMHRLRSDGYIRLGGKARQIALTDKGIERVSQLPREYS